MLSPELSPNETRVIGCLLEKSVTTPDQYPLTLNALVNACNQKSSREPVLNLDPGIVQRTVTQLIDRHLIMVQDYGSRVDRYAHLFCNTNFGKLQFSSAEYAVISLLMLRGPQTPGELKARSERLHAFQDSAEVDATLESLMQRDDGPFVARLPREPRRKDHCYAQLFSGAIESVEKSFEGTATQLMQSGRAERINELEDRVETLEKRLDSLMQALGVD